ncbi:clostripain-related cysteine peptidase [Anaeromusa acidaminophila]|uniref:clostripain-related cysteine peptidase n=1 Tax=Anaeromusa acidaminophila TaxID=81464 RepID=UPI000371D487|nr:clostripain-related cysteine peptidase [Anaeromusa acidaminophila]
MTDSMKKPSFFKVALALILSFFLLVSFTGSRAAAAYRPTDTWTIYWYVCGTDLESKSGAASADIQELLQVQLPANVRVLIQTGGAVEWHTPAIPAGAVGRYLYDKDGIHTLQELPDADMGAPDTLADFLRYGAKNYPADHRVCILWDHGGGSAAGVCYDERTKRSLSLNDLRAAFEAAAAPDHENPPFELIGFDACLMATADVMHDLHGLTRYMVASEEIEPGNGWDYTGWVGALARDPSMNGAALGKAICDTYLAGCEAYGTADAATLSVVDMRGLPKLREAYEAFGAAALRQAEKNPQAFFASFSRAAGTAVSYGGNTREQGYSNMVDLGSLSKNARSLLPGVADTLRQAVQESVVYKVNGPYRKESSGLSGYYSYNGDADHFMAYAEQAAPLLPMKCLYYDLIFGKMPPQATPYLQGSVVSETAAISKPEERKKIFDVSQLEDTPVDIDKDGNAFVKLSAAQMENLASVHCQLVFKSKEDDVLLYLGSDADINADWEKGIFKDNFQGKWPMLDGHPVYIEITYEGDGYNLYSVPIKLNGKEGNLQVAYTFEDKAYRILGMRRGIESNGMADKELTPLKAGDVVTTLHYAMKLSGHEEEFQQFEVDTFTLGAQPQIADEAMGDGVYGYCFEFVDPQNKSALSRIVTYTIKDGKIVTSVETNN